MNGHRVHARKKVWTKGISKVSLMMLLLTLFSDKGHFLVIARHRMRLIAQVTTTSNHNNRAVACSHCV